MDLLLLHCTGLSFSFPQVTPYIHVWEMVCCMEKMGDGLLYGKMEDGVLNGKNGDCCMEKNGTCLVEWGKNGRRPVVWGKKKKGK